MSTNNQPSGFGLAKIKREGDIMDPDEMEWECDLTKCDHCATRYINWLAEYEKQEANRAAH